MQKTTKQAIAVDDMPVSLPIAPALLKAAREREARLNVREAAERLSITPDELERFENGKRQPSFTFLQHIVKVYKISFNYFLLNEPPPIRRLKNHRTLLGRPSGLTFTTAATFRLVDQWQANLQQIISAADIETASKRLPVADLSDDIEALAGRERLRLQVSHAEQLHWHTLTDAFKCWRARIENEGIAVYLVKMNLDDCRGATMLFAGEPPAIIVNDNEPGYAPKIFTLLHEYGHILLREPGISDEHPQNKIEAFCNSFAAATLMPSALMREIFKSFPTITDKNVAYAAEALGVSRWAVAVRLETLKLAPPEFSDKFAKFRYNAKPTRKGGAVVPIVMRRLRELGSYYGGHVLNALRRDSLDRTEAARMLNVRPEYFRKIQEDLLLQRRRYGTPATAAQ